jgi:hypothetical protein
LLTTLFIAHWVNALVLVFSALPTYPLDGARMLHALLWKRLGYATAITWSSRIGFVVAILLGVTALLTTEGVYAGYLVALAFFCGFCCLREDQKMRFTEHELESLDHEELGEWSPHQREEGVVGRIEPDPANSGDSRQSKENKALDLILDKIQKIGMRGLSLRERWLLRRVSKRRRTK